MAVGDIRCAVCGAVTTQPTHLRQWDNDLDDELEADVCSGDCAKAWIDGGAEGTPTDEGEPDDEGTDADEGIAPSPPRWARSVEVADGKRIRYFAGIVGELDTDPFADPARAAELDARARAAYAEHLAKLTSAAASEDAEDEPTLVGAGAAQPARDWEVARWSQITLVGQGLSEPEPLETGLSEEEARARVALWRQRLADTYGAVVIAQPSPQHEPAESEAQP